MALWYVLVAILAIGGYAALLSVSGHESDAAVETVFRAAVVLAVLLIALPLGAFLGAFTVSAFTTSPVAGLLVLVGSISVLTLIGLGLYIVAEGAIPASIRGYTSAG